jgi:hypothetical protein
MSGIPPAYLRAITPLIETARGFLEEGQSLAPFAFVGNLSAGSLVPVMLKTGSTGDKESSAASVKHYAAACQADFVFVVMEAWSLRPDQLHRYREIVERYGSIGDSPYATDVVSFSLETRQGIWIAQVPIAPREDPAEGRTFDPPRFRHFSQTLGQFADLLPAKRETVRPHWTLH